MRYLSVCQARIPQEVVRECLQDITLTTLLEARHKLETALERCPRGNPIRDTSAYTRAVLYNCIAEKHSDGLLGA
jgi:hypothetical protein